MTTSALDESLCANLVPTRIVTELAGPEALFAARYGDTLLLLIKLQPEVDQLESGLTTSELSDGGRQVAPSVRAMAFQTVVANLEDVRATLSENASQNLVRTERLRWLLRNDRYYVAPLRKRSDEESFRDRVSVGRAVNKDVVLRHPNVSKLHAWFELSDSGGLYIADAGSSNGTFLNHERLAPRELTAVDPGHHLRFGSVEAVVCATPALWRAVRRN